MKQDAFVHILMALVTIAILVFNFNNVFGNLEASFVATTWVIYTSERRTHKKIKEVHEEVKKYNKEN